MMTSDDFKSFIAAVVLSAVVVLGFNYFFPQKNKTENLTADVTVSAETQTPVAAAEQNEEELSENAVIVHAPVAEVLKQDERLKISNNVISGSIRLKGARFDEILLNKYKLTLDADSPDVELLAPAKTDSAYYADYGWLSGDKSLLLPNKDTLWTVEGNSELTPQTPVTLVWNNGQGVKFIYNIKLDDNYLFDITQTVENNSGHAITVYPYGLFSKTLMTEDNTTSVVHRGFTGILDGDLKEIKYDKLDAEKEPETFETTGGWVSLTDRYWFSAFIFNDSYKAKITLRKVNDSTVQLDFKGLPMQIQSGSTASFSSQMYAGAKEIKLLDKYAETIKKFDLNVDFGWYYFLTKPFFYILDYLYNLIGNMGWAILVFAALLRLLMFPVANKSYEGMSKMKKIQPKVMALQNAYKDDKMALQRATMELYQREKVNPASGCLPILIQIPIFFSLYKVLNIAIEIRHAPFIGWIKDLSAPDPLTISTWAHIYVPSLLDIGVWPLIYGFTMFIQYKLNPAPANKDQARMMAMMPFIFVIMFAHFASGLVIYWTLSNILSVFQQKYIMYKNGVK
ncbi:MAG: membrane protein insertase YidC [Pseudomonadota bacterium]|nr:membrane protein insertase YidC [Pseudomonadota bacterium]